MKTIESEEIMLQVGSELVSLDVIERFFICDLEKCLGACCIAVSYTHLTLPTT